MIGVGEDDARAQFFERFMPQRLDGRGGSHRHECRGFNLAVRGGQASASGAGRVGLFYFKRKIHFGSLAAAAAKTLPKPLCTKPKQPKFRTRLGKRSLVLFSWGSRRKNPALRVRGSISRIPRAIGPTPQATSLRRLARKRQRY